MKSITVNSFLPLVATLMLAAALFWPASESRGNIDPQVLNALLVELNKQQEQIQTNQDEIDKRVAQIQEEVRMARIFARRGGGGGGAN